MLNQFDGRLIGGRYEVREHIATGGMASVFKTWDHRVERFVAIKILRSLDKNDLKAVERFRREARAAASLVHSNAVTIFDFFEEANQYYLVMEYIHGPTLKQLIGQRRYLHPHETLEIASQVCSVLHVAHNRGFIHRDIKPQNIMLASSGASINNNVGAGNLLVKLTDFGIVRVAEEAGLTNSGIVLGTADYLSPEQARGEKLSASRWTDRRFDRDAARLDQSARDATGQPERFYSRCCRADCDEGSGEGARRSFPLRSGDAPGAALLYS
jgi:serine/threonine protein kinase